MVPRRFYLEKFKSERGTPTMSGTASVPGWYVEFQAALLRQAPRPGEIDQTTAKGWTSNQKGLKKNLANCLLHSTTLSILELVSTVVVPATTSRFVAKEKFVVNNKHNASVKISSVWDDFAWWFLSNDGKIEGPISEQTLLCHKLRKSSLDRPIINELGGEAKAETTLSEMFSLMEKQKNGESGVLLNNSCANIFYIKDQDGVLRAVYVRWCGDSWEVDADPVGGTPDAWPDGNRVFSRLSVPLSVLESSGLAQTIS